MKKVIKKTWDLQLFAEEGDEAEVTNSVDDESTENTADNDATDKETKDGEGEPRFTQDDVDKIINRKLAQWEKRQEKKEAEKAEAMRLKTMSKEQTQAEKISSLEAQIEELKNKEVLTEMAKNARAILSEKGVTISDGLLSRLVTKDADETKENVDEFVNLFNKAVADEVKKRVAGKTPQAAAAVATISKEDILKIKDQTERQKKIAENINLFTGGN